MRIVWTFWHEKRPVQGEPIIRQKVTHRRKLPLVGDQLELKGTAYRVTRIDYKRRHGLTWAAVRLTDEVDDS